MNPEYFLSHVEEYIANQLSSDRLNLFLSNLSE